jgi:sulfur-carrier protein
LQGLIDKYPQLDQWRSVTRLGVNLDFVETDRPLQDGDELVLIPPVSGG